MDSVPYNSSQFLSGLKAAKPSVVIVGSLSTMPIESCFRREGLNETTRLIEGLPAMALYGLTALS